jgi:8-hydroxy-5-deazaflavin:NADPH oxidoreductase
MAEPGRARRRVHAGGKPGRSIPWDAIPHVLEQAGELIGKIVIETTNQFGPGPMPPGDQTAAQLNAARIPAARYAKSFNTLTAAFQAAAGRQGAARVVQWICGDDAEASAAGWPGPGRPGAPRAAGYRAREAGPAVTALRMTLAGLGG